MMLNVYPVSAQPPPILFIVFIYLNKLHPDKMDSQRLQSNLAGGPGSLLSDAEHHCRFLMSVKGNSQQVTEEAGL